jgi:hypothetical protein
MAEELNLEAGFAALFADAAKAMAEAVKDGPGALSLERVPRDTETLADGMQVSDPVIEGDTATVVLSYGRTDDRNPKTGEPSAKYAVEVHERTDVPHQTGQSKFLESAVLESAPGFGGQIAAKMGGG